MLLAQLPFQAERPAQAVDVCVGIARKDIVAERGTVVFRRAGRVVEHVAQFHISVGTHRLEALVLYLETALEHQGIGIRLEDVHVVRIAVCQLQAFSERKTPIPCPDTARYIDIETVPRRPGPGSFELVNEDVAAAQFQVRIHLVAQVCADLPAAERRKIVFHAQLTVDR